MRVVYGPGCDGVRPQRSLQGPPISLPSRWVHPKRAQRRALPLHRDWDKPDGDLRLFGPLRRESEEWRSLYSMRQAVERVVKGLKESRRLERHCVRGLRQIGLHATMSVVAFQATALIHVRAGETEDMRWMVRKVA